MVSGDDRIAPVLGYSNTNGFPVDKMPLNLAWWLGEYVKQIQYAVENNIEPTQEIKQQWEQISENGELVENAATSKVPLLKTQWSQGSPFNNKCPLYNGSDRAVTGCVATAMAQIMNYWKYPTSHTATIPAYTTDNTYNIYIPALEGTTFDWDNILDNYDSYTSAQADAVTTIGYEAFATWHSLPSVTIPENVTSLGFNCFGGCYNLIEIHSNKRLPR